MFYVLLNKMVLLKLPNYLEVDYNKMLQCQIFLDKIIYKKLQCYECHNNNNTTTGNSV